MRHQCHLLSIDVDDLLVANADFFEEQLPDQYEDRVEHDIRATLDTLRATETKATFFVNARYFDSEIDVLKEIASDGHELASHGFSHRNISRLTLEEFEHDLSDSLRILSKVQSNVIGYRPPAFSMPYDEEHFRILRSYGIRYVSSGVGVARSNAPLGDTPVEVYDGLLHVPISTLKLLGGRVKYPVGYGVASRLLPGPVYLATMRSWLKRRDFFHFYCHSFEVAGLAQKLDIPFRARGAKLSTKIYALRCRGREKHFKKVFQAAKFEPIGTRLF